MRRPWPTLILAGTLLTVNCFPDYVPPATDDLTAESDTATGLDLGADARANDDEAIDELQREDTAVPDTSAPPDGSCGTCVRRTVCEDAECVAGACVFSVTARAPCDDGDACTAGDQCGDDGTCRGHEELPCDDANVCTLDSCSPTAGCEHTPTAAAGRACVPEGPAWIGCPAELAACVNASPYHSVTTRTFEIDLVEVSVGSYSLCVAAGMCQFPSPVAGATFPGHADLPMNFLTADRAAAFCSWAGGRLCSEAEWEKAARGGCERYGTCDVETPTRPWGEEALPCSELSMYPCVSEVSASGSRPLNRSPYGLLDTVGNVRELVSDCWHSTYDGAPWDGSPWTSGCGSSPLTVARGGGFGAPAVLAYAFVREPGNVGSLESTGTRCCYDRD